MKGGHDNQEDESRAKKTHKNGKPSEFLQNLVAEAEVRRLPFQMGLFAPPDKGKSMKFHTNLPVRDIDATTRFYSLIFDEPPVKKKVDYVKFLPRGVALNISFHQADAPNVRGLHLGFEVSDQAALDSVYSRLLAHGLVRDERETSVCCYANQDKFWVVDPDGYEWEFYVLLEDTEQKVDRRTGCCASTDVSASGCCSGGAFQF